MASQPGLEYVDSHCHLNFDVFDQDRNQVVERARENGITRILNPGVDIETSKAALQCSNKYPEVYAAVGVHPNYGMTWTENSLSELKALVHEQKVVAIGEIGLDYYRKYSPKDLQRSIFTLQLELAAELGLPVIIHNRDASQDLLGIIQSWCHQLRSGESNLAGKPGVMHSFSGDVEFAREMASLNFKLGIAGPVTFKNSHLLQSVVRSIPLENLLIETDAPYLAPHPFRGKRNEPANVRIVAEKIAELKASPVDVVAKTTSAVADKLFDWRIVH